MPDQKSTVRVSRGGRVTLLEGIRQKRRWSEGTILVVEEVPNGVLLREAAIVAPSDPAKVFGMLKHRGAPVSIEDMDAGILAEARRRFERSSKS